MAESYIPMEPESQDSSRGIISAPKDDREEKRARNRIKLQQALSSMGADDLVMFFKMVYVETLEDILDAMKNIKKTATETWTAIITKLNSLKGMKIDFGGITLGELVEKLLPLVCAFAAVSLALRDADREESKRSANPDMTDEEKKNLEILKKESEDELNKSIVLSLAKAKENGFSL